MKHNKTLISLLAFAGGCSILSANSCKLEDNNRELSTLDKQRIEAAKLKRERKAKQKASRL